MADVYKTLIVTVYSKALTPDGAISSAGHLQKGCAYASSFVRYDEGVCYVLFFLFIRKHVPPGQETTAAAALRVAVTLKLQGVTKTAVRGAYHWKSDSLDLSGAKSVLFLLELSETLVLVDFDAGLQRDLSFVPFWKRLQMQ